MVESIFDVLKTCAPGYCLLRGYEHIFNERVFNDIDVIINVGDVNCLIDGLRERIDLPVSLKKVSPYQCVVYIGSGKDRIVLDLFFDVTWLGLSFYSRGRLSLDSIKKRDVCVLGATPSAYIIVMKELLQNGRVKAWSGARENLNVWISEDSERGKLLFIQAFGKKLGLRIYADIVSKRYSEIERDANNYRRAFLMQKFVGSPFSSMLRLGRWSISKFTRRLVNK